MAIATTNTATANTFGGSSATTQTMSFDCSGGTLLVVWCSGIIQSNSTITGVTYNGVAMTSIYNHGENSGVGKMSMWYLHSPASGSNNIVATLNGTEKSVIGAVAFTGTKTSSAFGTPVSVNNAGVNSVNITTVSANSMILGGLACFNVGTVAPVTGTSVYSINTGSSGFGALYRSVTTPTTYTIDWTGSAQFGSSDAVELKAGGNDYPITITAGAYSVTGNATLFPRLRNMLMATGSYVLTGVSILFNQGKGFQAITGSYILTGNNALFGKVISMLATSGSYAYTGFATGLAKTKLLIASVGNYIYNGIATGISHGRKITITKGTYTYTGFAVAVHRGVVLIAVRGTYALRGFNARMSIYWKNITKNVVSWVNEKKSNV